MVGRGVWMLAAVGLWTVTACGGSDDRRQVRQAAHVEPAVVPGNPTCPAGTSSLKIEPVTAGTYTDDGFSVTISFAEDGTLSYEANQGVDQVIVKGGPNANVYAYASEETEDAGLITPTNANSGQPYGYSHVDFCYDADEPVVLPLEVEKTATATQRTGWTWAIVKDGACPTLTPNFCPGAWNLAFRADVSATRGTSDWLTQGTIDVRNPNFDAATIDGVEDLLDGVSVAVDCGAVTFPFTLEGGAAFACTYEATTDGAPASNTASVTTSGTVEGNSDTVAVTVGAPVDEDGCITVFDQFQSEAAVTLGEVCVADLNELGVYRFEYHTSIEWQASGEWPLTNTASFVARDSGATGSDAFVTTLRVTCTDPVPDPDPNPDPNPMLMSNALSVAGTCQFHD